MSTDYTIKKKKKHSMKGNFRIKRIMVVQEESMEVKEEND